MLSLMTSELLDGLLLLSTFMQGLCFPVFFCNPSLLFVLFRPDCRIRCELVLDTGCLPFFCFLGYRFSCYAREYKYFFWRQNLNLSVQ